MCGSLWKREGTERRVEEDDLERRESFVEHVAVLKRERKEGGEGEAYGPSVHVNT